MTAAAGASTAAALDFVRVAAAVVEVQPDRAGKAQPGRTVFMVHEVVNAGPSADSYALTTTTSLGSTVVVLNDPNDDGDPDGSSTITNTGGVASDGERVPIITRARMPGTATHGQIGTVRTRATSDTSAGTDVATDTYTIYATLTYSDALFARPATEFFGQCSTVYVLAFRSGGGTYRFAWLDSTGTLVRASADISPCSDGSLDDFFDGGAVPLLGTWTVKLQERQGGGNCVDVGPSGTITFEMRDLVAGGARVALSDTGPDLYQLVGDPLVGYADVVNPTNVDVIASRIEHVAFFDGDGAPDAGEDYVRMDGSVAAWSAGLITSSRGGLDVYSRETIGDRFVTQPVTYTRPGVWTLRTTWVGSCGFLIAARNQTFTVGCNPPPTFAGIVGASDIDPCENTGISLAWDPVVDWGLGGTGTYAVYRSTSPGFAPDPSTLLAFGLSATSYTDLAVAPGTLYSYVVRAENSGNCSDGPNNFGLMDANFIHAEASDDDYGVIPVASFLFSGPACVLAGSAPVNFTDTSAGPPLAWSWDFDGDGSEDSNDANPTWAFPAAGDWTVSLTVWSPCGTDVSTRTVTVGDPPAASVTASRVATCTDEPVNFDGSASTAVAPFTLVGWDWDFDGDGSTDASAVSPPPHAYAAPGNYAATLTVTDSLGCTDTTSVMIEVNAELTVASLAPLVIDQCTGATSVAATAGGGRGPFTFVRDILTDDGAGTGTATFGFGSSQQATLTITDAAGCTATAMTPVMTVNPQLQITLEVPILDPCTSDVTLVAHASGGDGIYTFTFTNLTDDGTGRGQGLLPPGPYSEFFAVTDGAGCVASASVDYEVLTAVAGDFTWSVAYVGPGQFQADLAATATATTGTAPFTFTFTWDVGADGTPDGTGPSLTFGMSAQQDIPVDLEIRDANGCIVIVRKTVSSEGCPVDTPIGIILVRKAGTGIEVSWEASTHPCHGRYDVLYGTTARPATDPGTWPTDPAFTSVRLEDADASDQDTQLTLADPRAVRTSTSSSATAAPTPPGGPSRATAARGSIRDSAALNQPPRFGIVRSANSPLVALGGTSRFPRLRPAKPDLASPSRHAFGVHVVARHHP